jgi:hypothetical protein
MLFGLLPVHGPSLVLRGTPLARSLVALRAFRARA